MSMLILPSAEQALPGRDMPLSISNSHYVNGQPLKPPFAPGLRWVIVGMGCFWGAERRFWQQPGVITTAVGYAGGYTPNPTYEEACSGHTGHSEVVLVVFDPQQTTFEKLLAVFWESHDPTQGMRQGNDIGSQYRSVIYCQDAEQLAETQASAAMVEAKLVALGFPPITTEIRQAPEFYYAEEYHQQYLAKNPQGYCGLRGTGISCS
ncbi:MAG: peptide-methionine (S)-S-oxide reductase MsrA [Porticoccaceae bacterium]|nr:peptide-methionine (S)-S-oxide reductase MsrA [Porticoccaceae bacterium]